MSAFVYLIACSAKNRLVARLRRLKEPRYLIGSLVGVAYFALVFGRPVRRRRPGPMPDGAVDPSALFASVRESFALGGSVLLLLVALVSWVLPGMGQALTFTRSEVQFLFTAPVTRRALLHYKLLRSQVGILVGALVSTLFLRPGLGGSLRIAIGMWVVLATVRLHLMGVSLRRQSLAQHGSSALIRHGAPVAVVMAIVGTIAVTIARDWAVLAALPDADAVFAELQRLGTSGLLGVVLAPFRVLIDLPLSGSTAEFMRRLGPALAVLAVNYFWVMRSDAAFEEASAAHAERSATQPAKPLASPSSRASQPFALGASGHPEFAILWKNLIQVGRFLSVRTLLRVLPLVVVLGLVARQANASGGLTSFVAALCLPAAFFVVLIGPQTLRNDLRHDLTNLAVLKTWPVSGPALVRGSVLGPTVVLSAVAWLLVVLATVLARSLPLDRDLAGIVALNRFSLAVAAAFVLPAVILAQTVIHNGLAVFFPAWVSAFASRARGIDAMGQRLLMLVGVAIALLLALLPGAIVATVVVVLGRLLFGVTLMVLPAVVFAVVVVCEAWVAAELIGRVLARTDLSAVDAVEA